MHIGFAWVVWIYCYKGIQYVAANNRVPCKLQLDLVVVRLIYYPRVDILYFLYEAWKAHPSLEYGDSLSCLYFDRYILPELSLPNRVVKRHQSGKIISWYFWVQNIIRIWWRRNKIRYVFIGCYKIIFRFAQNVDLFSTLSSCPIGEW